MKFGIRTPSVKNFKARITDKAKRKIKSPNSRILPKGHSIYKMS